MVKNKKVKIKTMPNVNRYSIDMLEKLIDKALLNKIPHGSHFSKYSKENNV